MVRPTIYDVAERAGVSKSLVSLVLRGSPKVAESSRKAVEAAIAELGYRPSRAAAQLAAHSTQLVGVLIDDYTNLWFVELVRGLHAALGARGYRLSVADLATASQAEDPVEGMLAMRVDGIVVGTEMPTALAGHGVPPLVVAGHRLGAVDGVDLVANDDAVGSRLAIEHLAALGHRRIGHLAAGGGAGRARRDAAIAAADARGLELCVLDRDGPATEEAGFHAAARLLVQRPDLTALYAANDLMAVGVLAAARAAGRAVPGELSVMGYDNTALASSRYIDLSTVDSRSFEVGEEAGRLLLGRLGDGSRGPVHLLVEPRLVRRGTTARPGSVEIHSCHYIDMTY